MKVLKPQSLGLLTRAFEFRRKIYCGVAILASIPLSDRKHLHSEISLWTLAADVLGKDAALDAAIPKTHGEFLVSGQAWPTEAAQTTKCRVRVRLGAVEKTLNVFGDRYFEKDQTTPPRPFACMPLGWERAFGGAGCKDNPLGKGFGSVDHPAGRKVHPLPNIEYPDNMLALPGQRTRPAGFGAIDQTWPLRQRKAGTYDQTWLQTDYPGFAADIDWSFFNIASPDQHFTDCLNGDEAYLLEGLHPHKPRLEGRLPGLVARCFVRRAKAKDLDELACRLTTVWFLPEHERAFLIFHGSTEVENPDASDLSEIMIAADHVDSPRSANYYKIVFARRMDKDTGVYEMLNDESLLPEGFEVESCIDPDQRILAASESIRHRNLRERLDRELAEGRQKLDEEMDKAGVEAPPQEEPPDLGFEVGDLAGMTLRDLPALAKKIDGLVDQTRARLERQEQEGRTKLAEGLAQLDEQFPDQTPGANAEDSSGPPQFRAKETEAEIRTKFADMSSDVVDAKELESKFLDEDMLELYQWAETAMFKAYRLSAHFQKPAPASADQSGLREAFLRSLQAGESMAVKDFTGVDLSGLDLSGADLRMIFLGSANLSGADLSNACLDRAVLAHANLTEATLDGASFKEANLGRATLTRARANGADFRKAILAKADLTETVLDGSCLEDANLHEAVLNAVSLSGVVANDLFQMDSDLGGFNFSGAMLNDAVFINVDISEADFSGAQMQKVLFLNCTGVRARFAGANLYNLRIVGKCDFSGADFSGANLTESFLRECRLIEADFSSADLSFADLSAAQGGKSCFYHAQAVKTRFGAADLREADFRGANLMTAILERADIRGASLAGANLYQLDLARTHVDQHTAFDNALTTQMRTYPRKFPEEA